MIDEDFEKAVSERLRAARRVVIKLGTSIVTGADGQISTEQVQPIVRSIAALKRAGRQVVLVSSGAVVKFGVLPIVNENDTVSTAELEYLSDSSERIFGDNDRLAALLMSKLEADALILLTDVDGLFPRTSDESSAQAPDERAEAIPFIEKITAELRAAAAGPSATGRGGMLSKVNAAQIAMRAGGVAVIANGTMPETLDRIFAGARVGTTFVSSSRMHGKRRWIAYAANARGRVIVNAGARDAILDGKGSLLAAGVVRVEGDFDSLDVVIIAGPEGREFARGIANCASEEAAVQMNGMRRSKDRGDGPRKGSVLVARDNIVIL